MTPGARLSAAIEILAEIIARKSAADRTIAGWGKAHRFAGSKDRAAIADRVYTVLRRRNECAFRIGDDQVRSLVIGSLSVVDGLTPDAINALCTDGSHAPGPLMEEERRTLAKNLTPSPSTPWLLLNYPQWLHAELKRAFGDDLEKEIEALNERAPLDLRVNTLKARRNQVVSQLAEAGFAAEPVALAATALRLAAGADAKVMKLPVYEDGRIEIQDAASQFAVAFAEAKPGDLVIDLAAGAGGKTLAFASAMQNKGKILACDIEPLRLGRMEPRVARSGAKIIEIVGDPYGGAIDTAKGEGADIVFIDAPCSGTGTWRRNPESRWTLDRDRLDAYRAAQRKLLDRAVDLVAPGGRIIYAVCSLLPSEGVEQMEAFLRRRPGSRYSARMLTPARDATDGFYVAALTLV